MPVTSDLDIYRSANELIKQYGDAADIEAAMRADELMEDGGLGAPRTAYPSSQHPALLGKPRCACGGLCGPPRARITVAPVPMLYPSGKIGKEWPRKGALSL